MKTLNEKRQEELEEELKNFQSNHNKWMEKNNYDARSSNARVHYFAGLNELKSALEENKLAVKNERERYLKIISIIVRNEREEVLKLIDEEIKWWVSGATNNEICQADLPERLRELKQKLGEMKGGNKIMVKKSKMFCPECLKKFDVKLEKGKHPFCPDCDVALDEDTR
jgi:septal ring factor EnvC (AmiA/AmiB activator)